MEVISNLCVFLLAGLPDFPHSKPEAGSLAAVSQSRERPSLSIWALKWIAAFPNTTAASPTRLACLSAAPKLDQILLLN
jgi:hypothetical protein